MYYLLMTKQDALARIAQLQAEAAAETRPSAYAALRSTIVELQQRAMRLGATRAEAHHAHVAWT